MKKSILSLLVFVSLYLSGCTSNASPPNLNTPPSNSSISQPKINFDNEVFELKYSAKDINEYYLPQEKYSNWTKLVGVFYFPNETDHKAYARKFHDSLSNKSAKHMFADPKTDVVILVFTLAEADKAGTGGDIEDNIFKIEKSPKGGTIALQYANRYFVKSSKDAEDAAKHIMANQIRRMKAVMATPTPRLVEKKVDLGN